MKNFLRLTMALAAALWGAPAWAALEQELDVKVQQRTQKTVHGSENARQEEYGEVPNGLILERYSLDYNSENYIIGVEATNVGKNNQSVKAEGGQPGKMTWKAGWDQLPHLFSTEARSLYKYQGAGIMSLNPALTGFNQANAAAFNTNIIGQLSAAPYAGLGFNVETGRLDLRYHPAPDLTVEVGGWRQTRKGTKAQAASYGFSNAIELAAPIDYETNEAYLGLGLDKKDYQLGFNYRISDFNDRIPHIFWDNPKRQTDQYVNAAGYVNGDQASKGGLSMAPSNRAHAFKLEGGVNLPEDSRLSFEGGYQRWTAFNPMMPYTQNSAIIPNAFAGVLAHNNPPFAAADPANRPDPNIDTRIEVFTYLAKLSTRPFRWLRASLTHDAYIMENKSVIYNLPGFAALDGTWLADAQTTPREQVRDDKTALKVNYDVNPWLSGDVGLSTKYGKVTREVSKSRTNEASLGFTVRPSRELFINISDAESLRRANGYDLQNYQTATTAGGTAPGVYYTEAPGTRRADAADYNRNQARLQVQWVHGDVSCSFSARATDTNYRAGKSDMSGGVSSVYPDLFGTLQDSQRAVGVDTSAPLGGSVTADAYYEYDYTKRTLRSVQSAAYNKYFGGADTTQIILQDPNLRWEERQTDNSHIAGLQLNWQATQKLKTLVAYDLVFTRFNGDPMMQGAAFGQTTATYGTIAPYRSYDPSRRMDQKLRTRAEYKLSKSLTVAANYMFQKFDATDFQYQEVPLRDISNSAIFLGANPIRNYYAHTASVGLNYTF